MTKRAASSSHSSCFSAFLIILVVKQMALWTTYDDDEEDEEGEQTSTEYEEVLRLQALKLNRTADTLVDGVFSHCVFRLVTPYYILKEERAQDGGCHDEEDTRSEP